MDKLAHSEQVAQQGLSGYASLLLVAGVIAGAALALFASEFIFRNISTDLTRVGVIIDTLDDPALQTDIVALGNSVVMEGLDTRIINARLPGEHNALNLSNTGQGPVQGYLYYQELPNDISLIIQFINLEFVTRETQLPEQKYNAYYMYGYRPDARTETEIVSAIGESAQLIFDKSEIEQRFTSRWAVRQLADTSARSLFRDDLSFDRSTYDLQFPSRGGQKMSDEKIDRTIRREFEKRGSIKFDPIEEKRLFLTEMINRGKSIGSNYVLVLQPVHPLFYTLQDENFYADARDFYKLFGEQNNTPIIDAIDAVPGDMYTDGTHTTESGAEILSNFVADELIRLYENGELVE